MDNETNLIVWVVDEIDADLRITVSSLKRHLRNKSAQIDVVGLSAKPRKEDYLSTISNPRTAALILDQKLQTRGSVDHTGIQLALFLRNVAPNLPIYILTGYATENGEPNDEFNGTDWSVEDVLPKSILRNKTEMNRFVERLIRRINVHASITEAREKRFQSLLLKSLEAEFTPEERQEFDTVSFERLGALALSDQIQQHQLEDALKQLEEKLAFLDVQDSKDN